MPKNDDKPKIRPLTGTIYDLVRHDSARQLAAGILTVGRALSGQVKTENRLPERKILTPADLGLAIRQSRQSSRLSQQELADLAGVGRRFLSELENGKQSLEFGKVLSVATAAGIDLIAKRR